MLFHTSLEHLFLSLSLKSQPFFFIIVTVNPSSSSRKRERDWRDVEEILMTIVGVGLCRPIRGAWDRATQRCYHLFPFLSDPGRRSSWCLKLALVMLHLTFVAVLFLFDTNLIERTVKEPWYTGIYLLLFVATIAQYFFTAGSSPGYVLDAMRYVNETHAILKEPVAASKQSASSKNGSVVISVVENHPARIYQGANSTPWPKLVMGMYPPGSPTRNWTCAYCHVMQPPRSKHCHDCDKCVLQFDHHCVWLGTCIGQGNHCRFWWYILEETALCIWTGILYISYLKADVEAWWKEGIVILFLAVLSICLIFLLLLLTFHSYLILTNQTTYELVRRRRILYLRTIPEKVYPFSKGLCRNLYNFCCARNSIYAMEPLPTAHEIEAKAKPYTCLDVLSCRCC